MNKKHFRILWISGLIAALLCTAGCSGTGTASSSAQTDSYAQSLWNSRVSAIGNNSAVISLLSQLGIESRMGSFTIALQTDKEPYTLTLHFDQAPENAEAFSDQFHYYANLLLALIDNCGQVSCTYPAAGSQPAISLSWTPQNAKDALKLDVKTCGNSAKGIQTLLNTIRSVNQDNPNIMAFYSDKEQS